VRELKGAYLHATAVVTGDVELGEGVSLWPQVVIRGDIAPIRVGAGTNLQDGVILHTEYDVPLLVGEGTVIDVRDGTTALVADDAVAFAEACVRLCDDGALRQRLADAGAALFEERYTWASIEQRVGELATSVAG